MKRKVRNLFSMLAVVLTVTAGLCASSAVAYAQDDACSVATLNGSYGIQNTGSIVALGPVGPIAEAGVIKFDGAGGASQTSTVSLGGLGGISVTRSSLSGSYLVNADCTGDIAVVIPVQGGTTTSTSHFVIVGHGQELRLVNTGLGRVIAGTAVKQYPD